MMNSENYEALFIKAQLFQLVEKFLDAEILYSFYQCLTLINNEVNKISFSNS